MTRFKRRLLGAKRAIFLLAGVGFLVSLPAHNRAIAEVSLPAFNQNNLITDNLFTAYGFDGAGTNNFLRHKGSWLYGYIIPENQDVPFKYKDSSDGNCKWSSLSVRQFNDVTGETLYGLSAGDLIAKEGHDHSINPQVLVATLEKESSAVSRNTPQSGAVEMWVLGYGWDDTMAACGYSYNDSRARAVAYGGVGQQIAFAANGLQLHYNRSTDWQTAFTSSDGYRVTPENRATRALYRYTTYVYNGNRNFWYFFTLWFSDQAVAYEPKLVSSQTDVFIADEGQRWHINSAEAFDAWGFKWDNIVPMAGTAYAQYPGVGDTGRLIRTSWGRVFYLEKGRKRPVMSPKIFNRRGFRWDDVRQINDEIIKKIPTGIPLWELTRVAGTSTVYFQSRGENHPIASPQVFQDGWKFDWGEVADVPSYVVDQFPITGTISRLAKSNDGVIFFLDHGVKYAIPNPTTFSVFGFKWSDVVSVESSFLDNFPTQGTLRGLIGAPDGRVFSLDNGVKRYVSGDAFRRRGFSFSEVNFLDWPGLALFPNGDPLAK